MGLWILFNTVSHQNYCSRLGRSTYLSKVVEMLKTRPGVQLHRIRHPSSSCVTFGLALMDPVYAHISALVVPIENSPLLPEEMQTLTRLLINNSVDYVFVIRPGDYCLVSTEDCTACLSSYRDEHVCMTKSHDILPWLQNLRRAG